MSDEPIAPEPPRRSFFGYSTLVGILAFLVGIAVALGAVELGGGVGHRPAPQPALTDPIPLAPSVAPTPVAPAPAAPPFQLPPETDMATLYAREIALAARLEELEKQLADIDTGVRSASAHASQAERLLIAASVRRAVERGQPFGLLENQLRTRFGATHEEAVGALVQIAAQPVTLEDLRAALATLAPRLTVGQDDGFWARLRRGVADIVVVRAADTPSPRPADRLRRATRALDAGDVEAALAEIAHMPGAQSAESWTTAARRYVAARRALNDIERAAMQTATEPAPTNM